MKENKLKCSISGSFFKFKPEIDRLIDEFRGLGVIVLAPDKGWLYIPKTLLKPTDMKFRPLPKETEMTPRQIEDEFLRCIVNSDFLYIADFEGYVGSSSGLEMGFAFARGTPIYLAEPVLTNELSNPTWKKVVDQIKVATPNEVMSLLSEAGK